MLPAEFDTLLDKVPALQGRPRDVVALAGGLTNTNLKVTTPDGRFVARISSKDSDLLAIDRDAEYANSRAAAQAGIAPEVIDYLPEDHVMVVRFVDGRTYDATDLQDSANIPRAAAAVRQLHEGPRFVNEFNMFRIQAGYLQICQQRGFRVPDRYTSLMPQVARLQTALAVRDAGTVPCNNDLLAANFIDAGDRMWLIDYEYSGNNDACFELGNIWSESNLSLDQLDELVTAYYGIHLHHKVARARLLGLMSKYGWTLWASIQASTSTLEFDFWEWGMEKYDRALAEFDGPSFDALLDEATRAD